MPDHIAAPGEMVPRRIQLRRTAGWRMPPNTVVVARPTKWGNPFVMHHPGRVASKPMTPKMAVASFKGMVETQGGWFPVPLPWPKGKIPAQFTTVADVQRELRGRNLACWCALDQPCHADVLLELANAPLRCDSPAVPSSSPATDLDGTPTRPHTKETPRG